MSLNIVECSDNVLTFWLSLSEIPATVHPSGTPATPPQMAEG
jgi:hypothetical protein